MKTIVALEHSMLVAVWNMLDSGTYYADPGEDFFSRLNRDRAENRARGHSAG